MRKRLLTTFAMATAFSAYLCAQDNTSPELSELTNPDPHENAHFGSGVFMDGNRALVTATGYNLESNSNGAFYIYDLDTINNLWTMQEKIVHTNVTPVIEGFGQSAALSGDYALIGAYKASDNTGEAYPSGAAFVYERSTQGKWNQVDRLSLTSEDPDGQMFGSKVALDGDFAMVQADRYEDVYFFERQGGGSWQETQKISGSDFLTSEGYKPAFGKSIVIEGEYAFVSAENDDTDADASHSLYRSGSVYIFKRPQEGNQWQRVQKLTADLREPDTYFGSKIYAHGEYLLVGAPKANSDTGTVYIFKRGGDGQYQQVQKLVSPDKSNTDDFGRDISMDRNHIAVGAPFYEEGGVYTGAVFLYKREESTGGWVPECTILAPGRTSMERFSKVAMSKGNLFTAVARRDIGNTDHVGVVYTTQISANTVGDKNDGKDLQDQIPNIYPNPAKEHLTIEYNSEHDAIHNVEVLDLSGRKLSAQYNSESGIIDVSRFSNGTYFLKLFTRKGEVYIRSFLIRN